MKALKYELNKEKIETAFMKIEKEIVAAHHAKFDASPEDYIN